MVIKRFDTICLDIDKIKILKPDYIRLSRELGNSMSFDASKFSFVETLKEVGDLLDFSVLAENVLSETDLASLETIGITGASR